MSCGNFTTTKTMGVRERERVSERERERQRERERERERERLNSLFYIKFNINLFKDVQFAFVQEKLCLNICIIL